MPQMAWVSGYLARIVGETDIPQDLALGDKRAPADNLTILYGSQTGNAKGVAERLGARATECGVAVRTLSMADFTPRKLTKERSVLLVVSTHGEGEPPETAYALHRFLLDEDAPHLSNLRYAVLGLGDSSYEHFCRTGVELDRRLAELGAERMLPLQCCDVDYQADASRWSSAALELVAGLDGRRTDNVVPLPGARGLQPLQPSPNLVAARSATNATASKDDPHLSAVVENRRITTSDAVAEVRHLALEIDPVAVPYQPGDSLGIWFRNDPMLVDALLAAVRLDGAAPVIVDGEDTELRQALLERLELTRLHPTTVSAWAKAAGDDALSSLCADTAQLRAFAGNHQFIDLALAHPARIDAAALAGLLRPLTPRLYSLASSRAEFEDEAHLCVSVLRYQAHGRAHLGAASGHLGERVLTDAGAREPVPVYLVENSGFHLPDDGDTPLIMIGAGTGVAPYRAFLQHRAAAGHRGRNWLVFGNRHFHRDFLYQLDWQAQRKAGGLQRVSLTFSRDNNGPRYVQDRLLAEGKELYRWLEDGAHLYVCGSTAMGQAVHQTLLDIVATETGLSPEAADDYVDHLRRAARYHRDLY